MNKAVIAILQRIVEEGLTNKIYLASLLKNKGKTYPVIAKGDGYEYVGITDTECRFGYIRQLENSTFFPANMGCCQEFTQIDNYRFVLIDDSFKGNKSILCNIIKSCLSGNRNLNLLRMQLDSNNLLNQESLYNKDIILTPNFLHVGFDFSYAQKPFCCPQNEIFCSVENNVICKK